MIYLRPRRCRRCGKRTMNLRKTARALKARWAVTCSGPDCNWAATSRYPKGLFRGKEEDPE